MQSLSYAMCSSVLREVVAHGGSTVDDRWKNAGFKHFYDALLTYSNYGAVRTYEKFCYWMSWLRARLNRIWPWKKTSLIKHFMWLWKKQKAPKLFTIFPHFNPIFQTFYRSGKLLCKLQDYFKILRLWLKKLCHGEIYQNSNVGYRHQIERNINEK